MPTLADIYSAADSFKRRLTDAAMNPSESLQQMLGYANDRSKRLRELEQQADAEIKQGGFSNQGPATQELNQMTADAVMAGLTAWHGSPHIFEKFDLNKIGSGVGQQAYGKGLYLAESPATANEYKVNLSGYSSGAKAALRQSNNDFDIAMAEQQRKLQHYKDLVESGGGGNINKANSFLQLTEQNIKDLESMKQGIAENKGALYKVDLPDTHVRRMLDWDAPLKNQPNNVRALAKKLGMDMNDLGGDLVSKVGKDEAGRDILQKADIRGIKYINDQGVNAKEQTRNFVVFDPNHLTILERNAKPIK